MNTLTRDLLQWYNAARRELPWRRVPRDPYAVLVSELMLQQTQVDRVVPRFQAFVARFPDLKSLAAAHEEEVLAAWSGLGYYRRARLLHRLAREVVADGGNLPHQAAELARLPGVGPYTAAAVASLAFAEAAPVLDGNVARVASRILASARDPRTSTARRLLSTWVAGLFPGAEPGAVNEALMELGALVCTPRAPRCPSCPVRSHCGTADPEAAELIPPPRPKRTVERLQWVAACALAPDGRWVLRQLQEGPILRGLWLPPMAELTHGEEPLQVARKLLPAGLSDGHMHILIPIAHSITHRRISIHPVLSIAADLGRLPPSWRLVLPGGNNLPTSSLLEKLVHRVLESQVQSRA